jgi:hypothetical protein
MSSTASADSGKDSPVTVEDLAKRFVVMEELL